MPAPPPRADLGAIVAGEVCAARALYELLEVEQQALRGGETDGLPGIVAEKAARVEQLNRLAAERDRVLASRGLSPDRAGMQTALATDPAGREWWNRLLHLASRARERNALNGALIGARLAFANRALAFLNQVATREPGLYTPEGVAQAGPASRSRASV